MKNIFFGTWVFLVIGCSGLFDAPYVEAVDPCRGEDVVEANRCIKLRFSSAMNTLSVETNFALKSSLFPQKVVEGSFVWEENDRVLVFYPAVSLVGPATYYVELSSGVDKKGRAMQPFSSFFSFRKEKAIPHVMYTIPRHLECARPTNIAIIFDVDMDEGATSSAFRLFPSLLGDVVVRSNVLYFVPKESFCLGQIYTVYVLESAMSKEGGVLGEKYVFSFTFGTNRPNPVVTNIFYTTLTGEKRVISNYSKNMPKQIHSLVFEFQVPLEEKTSRDVVMIEPYCAFSNRVSNHCLLIFPLTNWETGIQYTLTIKRDLCSSNGPAMKEDYCFSFFVAGENAEKVILQTAVATYPWSENTINTLLVNSFGDGTLLVTFSKKMNLNTLLAFVSVSFVCGNPPGEFVGAIRNISVQSGNTYRIVINRLTNSGISVYVYKITFPEGGIVDEQGNPLLRTYEFLFKPSN